MIIFVFFNFLAFCRFQKIEIGWTNVAAVAMETQRGDLKTFWIPFRLCRSDYKRCIFIQPKTVKTVMTLTSKEMVD
jgi:hypothetical protein